MKTSMTPLIRVGVLALALAGLGGCSTVGKWFSNAPKPEPLAEIKPSFSAGVAWQAKAAGFAAAQSPLVFKDTVLTVDTDGVIRSLSLSDGTERWKAAVGAPASSGVGTDGRWTAVVTRTNELVVLKDGQVAWRKPLPGVVMTAPLVAGDRVFVLSTDRSVMAFDAEGGQRLWFQARMASESLALSYPSVLLPVNDTLVAAQGGRLTGFDPLRGNVRWEANLGLLRGSNEIERLNDLVAPFARDGEVVCTRAFQAQIGCVNADRGTLLWTKPSAGQKGVTFDDAQVYGADSNDRIQAFRRDNGEATWTNESVRLRQLSAPAVLGKTVVFGDNEGMLHFFNRANGEAALRLKLDGSPIEAAPVMAGQTLVVVTRSGGIFAVRPQ